MEKIGVEKSIWLNAPVERAWRAVTDPEQLSRWYATFYRWEIPLLQVGAEVKFYNKDNPADLQVATIEIVDAPRQFTLRWHASIEYPDVILITTFLLEPENDGTRATIIETGYESVPIHERQQWLDATAGGYTMSMENLQAHVEGKDVPH